MGELYKKPKDLEKRISDWPEPSIPQRGLDILSERYLRKDESGKLIENPKEMFYRVAHIMGNVDSKYGDFNPQESEEKFYNLMAGGYFMPNSPTLRGAGLGINLSACYVLPVGDSRREIIKTLGDAVEIQAFGGGTGFNFSNVRPNGSRINSTGGVASGPISFMKSYDVMIGETIAQGGTRQGANMGILNYNHGDIERFIDAKSKEGILSNFNISVGVTEEFMNLVLRGENYALIDHKNNLLKEVNAKEIFDKITRNAWASGDPGIIFLDRIDRDNPTPHIGKIVSTNPCGEQPLLPYEACNLGSINLRKFVENKEINYSELERVVYESVHFLDNVIDANKYPLKKIDKMAKGNRKIGLGVMGFADMLVALEIQYGSKESFKVAEDVMEFINNSAKEASIKLAETRGTFPNWKGSIYDPDSKHFKGDSSKVRNATRTTIAPTGTISNLVGVEGGIEPMFAVGYMRKSVFDAKGNAKYEFPVINQEFERIAKEKGFYSEKLIEDIATSGGSLEKVVKPDEIQDSLWNHLKKIFTVSHNIPYDKHIKMQESFQKHVDNAVSKTINLPSSATVEDVFNSYMMAYESGLKGITIYRDGSKKGQVLSTQKENKSKIKSEGRPAVIGTTVKQLTPFGKSFITINVKKDDMKTPYEVFVIVGKGGADISAIAEGYGRLISLLFFYGCLLYGYGNNSVNPLEDVCEQLSGIRGETQVGFGENKIPSLPHAIATGLREGYYRINKSIITIPNGRDSSGNLCPDCGSKLIHESGCEKCLSCGYSKC